MGGILGSIGDTIGHLFGSGSTDRAAQRAGNNAGGALTQEQQTLAQVAPWLLKQGQAVDAQGNMIGQAAGQFGAANTSLANQGNALGLQAGELGLQNAALGNQGNALGLQAGTAAGQQTALGQQSDSLDAERQQIGNLITAAMQQGQLGGTMAGGFGQYFPGALSAYMQSSGLNPDGTANASFDPYGRGVGDQMISTYADKAAKQGDSLVATANKNLAASGFGGGASALQQSQLGDIARGQTQDVQNYTRNLGVQGAQEKYARQGNAINALMGLGGSAGSLFGNAGSGFGNAAGDLGSNASGYGSVAGGYNNLGNLFGNVASGWGNVGSGYGNVSNGFGNVASGWGNVANGQTGIGQGLGQLANLWGNVGTGYGNVGGGYQNLAGGYGQLGNGYNGQQQIAQQQGQQTTGNLLSLAGLFG